jgi:integrase
VPALKAAGPSHRRISDMRHTFATWSLAAGMSTFTLARRMGTSLQMIDRTHGHLAQRRRGPGPRAAGRLRKGTRNGSGHVVGTEIEDGGAV